MSYPMETQPSHELPSQFFLPGKELNLAMNSNFFDFSLLLKTLLSEQQQNNELVLE